MLRPARLCILAGAQFIVSPALDLDTIAFCRRDEIVVLPGAMSPTEVLTAWKAGADLVKVFPAGSLGRFVHQEPESPVATHTVGADWRRISETAADFIKAGASALGSGDGPGRYECVARWRRAIDHRARAPVRRTCKRGARLAKLNCGLFVWLLSFCFIRSNILNRDDVFFLAANLFALVAKRFPFEGEKRINSLLRRNRNELIRYFKGKRNE